MSAKGSPYLQDTHASFMKPWAGWCEGLFSTLSLSSASASVGCTETEEEGRLDWNAGHQLDTSLPLSPSEAEVVVSVIT